MNREEIENRIFLCEERERDYREVGNTKTANRYSNEKYKWEQLLSQLRSDEDEETIRTYKRGYYQQKNRWDNFRNYLREQLSEQERDPKLDCVFTDEEMREVVISVFVFALDKMNELEKSDSK